MQQYTAGAFRATAVAGVYAVAAHIHAVGIGHAHAHAVVGQQVGDQPHGGGFSVGARYRHDGNASVLPTFKHGGNNGVAHRTAFAIRGREVHAQARCGIDFYHATALLFDGVQNAVAHHVYTANI